MLQFSTGLPLLLLHWINGLVLGEVSKDFSNCLDFFYNKSPPKGISAAGYEPICQRYKNQYHFASLYDREHRVPLYSAYILGLADGKRPSATWMYEPQVDIKRQQQPFLFSDKMYLDNLRLCVVILLGKTSVLTRAK